MVARREEGVAGHDLSRCRKSLPAFIEAVLLDDRGQPLRLAAHQRLWLEHIDWCFKQGLLNGGLPIHAGVIGPMGHGKSILQFGIALYRIGVDQNVRIKFVCGDEGMAKRRLKGVARYIEGEMEKGRRGDVLERYREIFPDVEPDPGESWTTTELFVRKTGMSPEPTLHAQGIDSSGTGGRADFIIFDDCVTFRNAIAEPGRQAKIIEGYQTQWRTRLEGVGSQGILIGTPYTASDLHAYLQRASGWLFLHSGINEQINGIECEVATDDPSHPVALVEGAELVRGRWRATLPLFESRWPRPALVAVRGESRLTFDRCYRCKVTTGLSGTFPSVKRALVMEAPEEFVARPPWAQCVSMGLDPANQTRLGTTLAVMGLVPDHAGGLRRRLLHIERNRLNAPDTMRRACALHAIFKCDIAVPEINAYQKAALLPILNEFIVSGKDEGLARIAEDLRGVMHEWFTSGANKNTDVIGLEGLELSFSNNQIVIPALTTEEHRPPCTEGWAWVSDAEGGPLRYEPTGEACAYCQLVSELQTHPSGTQDCIMSLWLAWRGICERAGDLISSEDQFATFSGFAGARGAASGALGDLIGATSMQGLMNDLGLGDGNGAKSLTDLFSI